MERLDTRLDAMEVILAAVHSLLHGTSLAQLHVPTGVGAPALDQATIGWDQLLKGRAAKSWGALHQIHLGQRATHRNNGSTWITNIVTCVFQEWWKLWMLRNNDRHGRDAATSAEAARRQAIREIHLLYENHQSMPQNCQFYFARPLEEKQQWTTSTMRIWINLVQHATQRGHQTQLETG